MSARLLTLAAALALALLWPSATGAQSPPEPDAPAPPPASEEAGEGEEEIVEAPPAEGRRRGGTFVPSEEIEADSEIAFPVDI